MINNNTNVSDDDIIKLLQKRWGCDKFIFDCKIGKHPQKTDVLSYISNVKYQGKILKYPNGQWITCNVKQALPYGDYKMEFVLAPRDFREQIGNLYLLKADAHSFVKLNPESQSKVASLRKENNQKRLEKGKDVYSDKEQELFEYWGVSNCNFIGLYHYDEKSGHSSIDDIRKPNFAKIPYYPNDEAKKPITLWLRNSIPGLNDGNYYLFNWKLSEADYNNPYEIYIDFKFKPQEIRPQWFIEQLFNDRYNDKSKNFESSTNFLDTLSKQLSAKESTFIYELLQNANDYPVDGVPVDVEFRILDNYLVFMHSGDYFNVRNISGICGINEKEKSANKKTIGYKGIGFKTVFLNNHYVYIRTGEYSFRFEEKAKAIKRLEAPWPILPIWTGADEIPKEILPVIASPDAIEKYRVQIALRPDNPSILHYGRKSYENLFKEVFEDSNLILFIPNVRSVKVYIGDELVRDCIVDEDRWVIGDYEQDIDEEFQKLVNKDIETGKSRIPEKYKDFDRTKVSFACRKEGRKLLPVENAHLYCYLPTSASWEFPFLLNTDMIPKGDRDDIEREVYLKDEDETNFNLELAKIAGKNFFCWIQDLIKSGSYDYDSIFSLVPDFDKCIKETDEKYKDFIENFKSGFESLLDNSEIVPVLIDKQIAFKSVSDMIYDTTGLSCAGIMSDDDILSLSNWDGYFPHPLLRNYSRATLMPGIKSFLSMYHIDDQLYDKDVLHDAVEEDAFQKWLALQDNNDKFLEFLLKKNLVDYFDDSQIFLAESGGLYKPEDLYYSVDDYYEDLTALDSYLGRLSLRTRILCEQDKDWEDFKDNFKTFDPDDFVDDVLLDGDNKEEVCSILSDVKASIPFMHFLSRNVGFAESYKDFPFVDSEGSIIENFKDVSLIFAPSEDAESMREETWFDRSWIAIISSSYDEVARQYFLDHFGVRNYADKIVIDKIICNSDYQEDINNNLEDFEANKSFVEFVFQNRDAIKDNALSGYVVSSIDKNGDESFLSDDSYYIYIRNKIYSDTEGQNWLDNELMYALNEAYYQDSNEITEYKTFFETKFGIPSMTGKLLLEDIILKQADSINKNLEYEDVNVEFWRWVKGFAKEPSTISKFSLFYLLVKELDEADYRLNKVTTSDIYLSNAYQVSSDIEVIVKKYAPSALFVAPDYLESNTNSVIKEWVDFFMALGVQTTIEELVFNKIIPNIGEIQEEGLPNLLGLYYDQIQDRWEEILDNRKSVKQNLRSICVKTCDGVFTPIKECILVDISNDKEPFKDIVLDKEITSASASSRNAKKLLLDISQNVGGTIIKDVVGWQERKLNAYAGCEEDYSVEVHLNLIDELIDIDSETLKTFECRKRLRLLDVDDNYCEPEELTLSSEYKTSCLFDKYGIKDGLIYLSHRYVEIDLNNAFADFAKKILNVHYRFEKEDIKYLSNYKFAVYFWSEYALRHKEFIEDLIDSDEFDNVPCIPTMAGNVYAPEDVYSSELNDYVIKKIPEWEDKVLTDEIPVDENGKNGLIEGLKFKEQLSFEDGLNALRTIKGKEKRREILEWMNEDYDDSYSELISEYRNSEDAIWKNGKAEDRRITELYAIAPESKTLYEFFRDNEYILHSDYISNWNKDDYRSICNMMQIHIIEENEMSFDPVGEQDSLAHYFEGRLLVVAGIEDTNKWNELFEKYKEKISMMSFWRCSSISWTYEGNDKISQKNKKFYSNEGDFYYVKDWCTKQVYTDFVREMYDYLECSMNEDQFKNILDPDEDIQDLIEDYYSLRTDEYIAELAKYDGAFSKYSGRKVTDEVEEEDGTIEAANEYRPKRISLNNMGNDDENDIEPMTEAEDTSTGRDDNEIAYGTNTKAIDTHFEVPTEGDEEGSTEWTQPEKDPEADEDEYDDAGATTDFPEVEPEPEEEYYEFDPDEGDPIGDVTNDRKNYEPVGFRPTGIRQARRKAARPFTKEEMQRLRSNGTPLELESLPATQEELDLLSKCGISPEQIADTNYLAQLRLYRNLQDELGESPEESLAEFIRNADDVAEHKMSSGKYVHACSAARGVMYVSPSVWNKMVNNQWVICVYLDGQGKNFHYINTAEEFLKLVQKDDVVIKITGKEKVDVVNKLYTSLLANTKGTAYTLVRVAARTNMDAVFAHYVGAMAETNDGNEDEDLEMY